jgi:hypothetical protein
MPILRFTCTSAIYPVFRDYKTWLVNDKTRNWHVKAMKDELGGTVKMELIDPSKDPLIDDSEVPLKSSVMNNTKDVYNVLKMSYKPTKSMNAIVRITAMGADMLVLFDVSRLEQMV